MEKINELIVKLMAIENFCKDIHYNNVSYDNHLLADRIHDGIDTFLDDIKEQIILSKHQFPLPSREYLKYAVDFIPEVKNDDNVSNWEALEKLIDSAIRTLDSIKENNRGCNALLDNIAQNLNTSSALIFIQIRNKKEISEEVKHDKDAMEETPVDRKEFKETIPEPNNAQKVALKYDQENTLVAEENTLDKLSKKLGI